MKRSTLLFFFLASAALAQDTDAEGCKDSPLISRMTKCNITECSKKEYDGAELLTGFAKDDWIVKNIEGETERIEFACAVTLSPLQIARNMEAALRKAGYQLIWSGKGFGADPTVTGRKGDQWIQVRAWMNGDTPSYSHIAIKEKPLEQEVIANAEAWAGEIEKNGRVAVYGINFDTGKATLQPGAETVLAEVAKLALAHPEWRLTVEGHTDSTGAKPANLTLSKQRAQTVVGWLAKNGVPAANLTAEGFGDTKPLAENTTEQGRAQNRRVELVKQ
jgi:outer membrane protein OmpA-like peptidoglycan-associated protein